MKRIVISDTSCLIVLDRIGLLEILSELFGEIWITKEIALEYGEPLPDWIAVQEANEEQCSRILRLNVDRGEASTMALYLEQKEQALLVIDEKKGRMIARDLGIRIIGTLGILVSAKRSGLIENFEEVIDKLEEAEFRLFPALRRQLLDY